MISTSAEADVRWNGIAAGAVVMVIAIARLSSARLGALLSLAAVAMGGWLIMSPLIFGYVLWAGAHLVWNDLITGILVTVFALASYAAATLDNA